MFIGFENNVYTWRSKSWFPFNFDCADCFNDQTMIIEKYVTTWVTAFENLCTTIWQIPSLYTMYCFYFQFVCFCVRPMISKVTLKAGLKVLQQVAAPCARSCTTSHWYHFLKCPCKKEIKQPPFAMLNVGLNQNIYKCRWFIVHYGPLNCNSARPQHSLQSTYSKF